MVPACGSDLERPSRGCHPSYLRHVGSRSLGFGCRSVGLTVSLAEGRRDSVSEVQHCAGVGAVEVPAIASRPDGNHTARAPPICDEGCPERTPDGPHLPVQGELTQTDGVRRAIGDVVQRRQNSHRDRKVVSSPALWKVCGRQVHGDPPLRKGVPTRCHRGADTLFCLAHGCVRQPDEAETALTRCATDVGLDLYGQRTHSYQSDGSD